MYESKKLDSCPQCQQDLEKFRKAMGDVALKACPNCQFPVALVAGKYRLEHMLGEGAFGKVYLARHIHLQNDAERAIKVIQSEMADKPGFSERFMREVQVTSSVSQRNEHIVRVYDDFGHIHGIGHFYVMEYLRGRALFDLLEDSPPNLATCLHIFGQICKGMAAAHEAGIVHRDLKPENVVLIERGGDPHFAKVVDFGIARPLDDQAQALNLTQGIIGTPYYMAPEQCSGGEIDARTDIYSLGAVLFEMLAGHSPFENPGVAQTPLELLTMHMVQEPPRFADVCPERQIPEALEAVVRKALQKRPEARFQSMVEFWQAAKAAMPSLSATHSYDAFAVEPGPPQMAPESMVPAKGEPTTEGLFTAWPSVVVKDDDDAPPEASSQPSAALAPPVTLPPLDMTEAAEPTSTTRWWIPALALLLLGGGGGAFWWSQHKSSKLPPKAPLRAKVVTPPRTKAAPAPRKNTKAPEPQTTIDASANTPDAHSIEPRPITRRKTRTHRPKSRTRRRALRRRVKPRPRVAVLPRPRPQQPSGPVGCAVLPSLPCVKVTIQPSSIKAKLRITRGKARIREGRGGTCICFAASRTVQVHVEALLFRPCTVKLSHRSLYQKWTLQRTNPDELEGGQDDYCK